MHSGKIKKEKRKQKIIHLNEENEAFLAVSLYVEVMSLLTISATVTDARAPS